MVVSFSRYSKTLSSLMDKGNVNIDMPEKLVALKQLFNYSCRE